MELRAIIAPLKPGVYRLSLTVHDRRGAPPPGSIDQHVPNDPHALVFTRDADPMVPVGGL